MKMKIIGRDAEREVLDAMYQSGNPEFIALYGRRRVGKTYLVRNHFINKKGSIFFYVTGIKEGSMADQLVSFMEQMSAVFYQGVRLETQKNWRNTFGIFTDAIKTIDGNKKIVLFLDEFPWMVTKNSKLLQILEYYWNHYWSRDSRIKLIICGSSSAWILKNIINNRGGLYNRVTRTIHLEPFDLNKTKTYLSHYKVKLNHKQIIQLYMVLGGIPFYLSQAEPGFSASQIIEKLAFRRNGFLFKEFSNLYATLFDLSESHTELMRSIANFRYGIGQEELTHTIQSLSSGGRVTALLEDLEQADFVVRFKPFSHSKKGIYYRAIDEYSLFYFRWIEPIRASLLERGMSKGYWEKMQNSPAWYSWTGYAFEAVCYKHIPQISKALKLSPAAIPYVWRYVPRKGSKEEGAQIDLLFDRPDGVITVCEIKYTDQPFIIDKSYAEKLKQKMNVFKRVTKTKKQIFLAIISASGLKRTIYSEDMVTGLVTLDDLFNECS